MEEILNILHKKLRNESLSLKEEEAFGNWISSTENQEIFNDYEKIWNLTGSKPNILKPDVNMQWQKFSANTIHSGQLKSNIRSIFKAVSALAAMFVFIFGITSVIIFYTKSEQTYTATNTVLELTLPDSSIVFLNKNSTLVVASEFNKRTRTVKLKGEALFEVEKKQDVPFIVEMEHELVVKVLGTTFNLRTFSDATVSELRVLEGKVLFEKAEKSVVVSKNEEVVFNTITNNFSETKLINNNLLAWHTKTFHFNNTPLSEVIFSFERFLNKKIECPQNLSEMRYTGEFSNPKENEMAEVLSLALGWNYVIDKDTIRFSSK